MFPSLIARPSPAGRRTIRYLAAAIAAGCAAVYFAIGLGLVYPPSQDPEFDAGFMLVFGFSSAFMFALGAALLLRTDRRAVLVLGALFQVFVIVAYFQVSGRRDPHFEIWGLSLKAAQAVILVALLDLLRPWAGLVPARLQRG